MPQPDGQRDEALQERVKRLEAELAALRGQATAGQAPVVQTALRSAVLGGAFVMGVRRRSSAEFFGWPLYDIAFGPDPSKGELRGKARGIIAVGDIAVGALAFGGFSRGLVAVGGCALGILAGVGGVAVGALALGGFAIGGVALGGMALGHVAIGGCAIGNYAYGGEAFGEHIFCARRQDPEAIKFLEQWAPALKNAFVPALPKPAPGGAN